MSDEPLSWEEYRRKMLEETSRFIEWGLNHPDEVVRIPIFPAGRRSVPGEVAEWFWLTVLSDKPSKVAQWWRSLLKRGY